MQNSVEKSLKIVGSLQAKKNPEGCSHPREVSKKESQEAVELLACVDSVAGLVLYVCKNIPLTLFLFSRTLHQRYFVILAI